MVVGGHRGALAPITAGIFGPSPAPGASVSSISALYTAALGAPPVGSRVFVMVDPANGICPLNTRNNAKRG